MTNFKKIEIEILDPTGVVVDKYGFPYSAGAGNRLIVTINGNHFVFTHDGEYKYKIGEKQRPDTCKCCGKPMKPQGEIKYICMNPYCDEYIKIQK